MEWNNEMIMEFLDLYEQEPVIWDPRNPYYKDRNHVYDAWKRIENRFSIECSLEEFKKKKESLMATYRKLATKVKKGRTTYGSAYDAYQPEWFAYAKMASFLDVIYTPRLIKNCEAAYAEQELLEDGETTFSDADNSLASLDYLEQDLTHESRELSKRVADDDPLDSRPAKLTRTFLKASEGSDNSKMYGKYLTNKLKKLDEATRNDLMREIDLVLASRGQEQEKSRYSAQNVNDLAAKTPDNGKLHNENGSISNQLSHIRKDLAKWRNNTLDEGELCARTWAMEYNRLNGEQQLHAKKAINDILYEGRLGRLSAGCVRIKVSESLHKSSIDSQFSSSIVKIEHDIDCD